jgi:hypothetical protein
MRKLLLGLMALLVVGTTLAIAGPASAATSPAPTTSTPTVARGHSIRVLVNAHGSKVLSRTSTLWQNGHRVYDWSPKPGLYRTKSVIRYQIRTTTTKDVWVPADYCNDYSYEGYDACAEGAEGGWDTATIVKLGAARSVTRWTYARVHPDESPGCVSRTEWAAARVGMTMTRIHSMFGTSGTHSSGYSTNSHVDVNRDYRACASFGGDLSINFDNYSNGSGMRLYDKTRYTSW